MCLRRKALDKISVCWNNVGHKSSWKITLKWIWDDVLKKQKKNAELLKNKSTRCNDTKTATEANLVMSPRLFKWGFVSPVKRTMAKTFRHICIAEGNTDLFISPLFFRMNYFVIARKKETVANFAPQRTAEIPTFCLWINLVFFSFIHRYEKKNSSFFFAN